LLDRRDPDVAQALAMIPELQRAKRSFQVLRFTNSGINIGPFMGNPPTGKHAKWLGIGIYTIRDGRVAEAWFAEDILTVLTQLNLLLAPG
jgi:predicted ester cyclase